MKTFFSSLAFLSFFPALFAQNDGPPTASAEMDYHLGFRIAPRVSTLGGGLEVAKGLSPRFGLRGGFNYFTYQYDATEDGGLSLVLVLSTNSSPYKIFSD